MKKQALLTFLSSLLVLASARVVAVTVELVVPDIPHPLFESAQFIISTDESWQCKKGETCELELPEGWSGSITFKHHPKWAFRGFSGSLPKAVEWDPQENKRYLRFSLKNGIGSNLVNDEVYTISPVLFGPYSVISDVRHNLGSGADVQFDFQIQPKHDCPNFYINHGSKPFLSLDLNRDGISDPLIFYTCARVGEEELHPYYFVGPSINLLVMLSTPAGDFVNGNNEIFGKELVKAGYFASVVGYEMEDRSFDFNEDGYPDFVWHTWRDGIWDVRCYTEQSYREYDNCWQRPEEEEARYRWLQAYDKEGNLNGQGAPGASFSSRGILLSNGDGSYEAKIIAMGQQSEPGPISVVKDDAGFWTIWIKGPTFGAGAGLTSGLFLDEWDTPLSDGTVLPEPSPKVFRFEGGEMLDVTTKYFTRKNNQEFGTCWIENARVDRLREALTEAGLDPYECNTWDDPRFDPGYFEDFQYIPFQSDPSKAVSWNGYLNRSFLTRICPDQQGKICAASDDRDEAFGKRFSVPVMRTWQLKHDVGWEETTRKTPTSNMTLIPVPKGMFFKLGEDKPWGYSFMDYPNGDIEPYKLNPNNVAEHATFTCCHNSIFLKDGIEPEDLGDKMFDVQRVGDGSPDWTPENCPTFIWGVEKEHCETPTSWINITPSAIHEGAPANLIKLWMRQECGEPSETQDYQDCLASMVDYRYDALKAGFLRRTLAFKNGRSVKMVRDPLSRIGLNAEYYPSFTDVNGDGFVDFVANRTQWFPDWFPLSGKDGNNNPAPIVALNTRAGFFRPESRYWDDFTTIGMNDSRNASKEDLDSRLIDYYMGNIFRDLDGDGMGDLFLFDIGQGGLEEVGLPEVTIGYGYKINLSE